MAVKKFNTRIQLKNDTSTNWSSVGNSFTPLAGEFIWDSTNSNFKMGDGTTKVGSLEYVIGAAKLAGWTTDSSSTGTITASDSLETALHKLENQIGSVTHTTIDGASGAFATDNTLTSANYTLGVVTSGYLASSANGVIIDTASVDSTYTTASGSNLATVDTVSTAISGLTDTLTGTPGVGNTVTAFDEVDGKVTATFAPISITASQVSDLASHTVTSIAGDGTYISVNTATGDATVSHIVKSESGDTSTTSNLIPGGTITQLHIASDAAGHVTGIASTTFTAQTVDVASASATGYFADAKETKDYVDSAIASAIDSEMTFMGVTTSTPSNPENGDMWKAGADFTLTGNATGQPTDIKANDTIIYKGGSGADAGWYVIRHDTDTDTWRAITVNGTDLLGSGISTGSVNFASVANNPVTVSGNGNDITIQHETKSWSTPTAASKSAGDTVTLISTISNDGYGHIASYETSTFTLPAVNDATLTIVGAANGPISVGTNNAGDTFTANAASAKSITITHNTPTTTGTTAAYKIGIDSYGHVTDYAALTATDVSATTASYGGATEVSTVQGALDNLSSGLSSHTHNIEDLGQESVAGNNTIIFDCGDSTRCVNA